MEGIALSSPTAGRFAGCLGQTFKLHAAGSTLDLVLFEVEELGPTRPDRTAFSLLFSGRARPVLPQPIYPLANPAMGAMELFLVPLGPRDGGMCYQAIFT